MPGNKAADVRVEGAGQERRGAGASAGLPGAGRSGSESKGPAVGGKCLQVAPADAGATS